MKHLRALAEGIVGIFTAMQGKPLPTVGNLIVWWRGR